MKEDYRVPQDKILRIAISGASGCGNTTVSGLLAEKLRLPCINYTFKNIAKELNIPFTEIIQRAKTDFSYDKKVDTKQVELAQKSSCVLGSRLAIWLLKEADLKVYLFASEEERAKRVQKRDGGELSEIKAFTAMRDKEDTRRYKMLYNIDNSNYQFADLIIDTEKKSPEEIVELIISCLLSKNLIVKTA
ncbi:cytidylate kinase [Treponema phagedenis]|uniref:Cytidylate kinase n=1 Tax=Treponema phagedenis TaxID=162 RepID=A0A0B7GWB0_TREPH|nr:cytidylate kinase family protein [Treponema phagedenis]EFW38774.1 putative cytidylate kinase [Treponema phagedenis F0421]NVP25246.1 cytidylate kinase family protein [Treponema phagedenis]QEJ93901.1 AAA family ATPase [Treponema phagedenis]QEJ97081.1 AAA family ATPase [Treponema phagedenis]QEJ99828.1 AAA family ATPase [Treponema phagedenis]